VLEKPLHPDLQQALRDWLETKISAKVPARGRKN
jgi:hypothetical protein